jgi:hypothetical protein
MLPHIEGTEVHFIKIAARRFSGFKTYTIDSRTAAIRDPRPLLDQMIQPVVDGFRFLEDLTDSRKKSGRGRWQAQARGCRTSP